MRCNAAKDFLTGELDNKVGRVRAKLGAATSGEDLSVVKEEILAAQSLAQDSVKVFYEFTRAVIGPTGGRGGGLGVGWSGHGLPSRICIGTLGVY